MKEKHRKQMMIGLLGLFAGLLPLPLSASEASEESPSESVQALVTEAQRMAEKWAERIRGWSDPGEQSSTYLGVVIEPVPDVLRDYINLPGGVGLLLRRIASESPAERGGLKDNDILLSFDGQLVINYDQLSTLIELRGPGAEVPIRILRKGEELELTVVLEERIRKGGRVIAPDTPNTPDRPDAPDAPDTGGSPDMGLLMEKIEEWIPGSVRVYIDDNEEVHVDLAQLRETLEDLKVKVGQLQEPSAEAPEIRREYGDMGARTTIVRVEDRTINYEGEEGKLVLRSSGGEDYAMVWNTGGELIFEGTLPEDFEESLPEAAVRLIKAFNASREKLQLDSGKDSLEIILNDEAVDPLAVWFN